MSILLKNGSVLVGETFQTADILIENDTIAAIGADLACDGADRVIDLEGLSLAPGFIDAHSHNDWFALRSDPLPWFAPFMRYHPKETNPFCWDTCRREQVN